MVSPGWFWCIFCFPKGLDHACGSLGDFGSSFRYIYMIL